MRSLLIVIGIVALIAIPGLVADDGGQKTPTTGPEPTANQQAANHAVMTEGHQPGRWTMDYEAARAYAAENKVPLLLNFTGSDWCGWCKMMDKTVFSDPAWSDYAAKKMVLVTLDFPRNKKLVPEAFRERNAHLRKQFGVAGFPIFVVLESDGREVGRLLAGQGKTGQSFAVEAEELVALTDAAVAAFTARLSPAAAGNYRDKIAELRAAQAAENAFTKENKTLTPESLKILVGLNDAVEQAEDGIRLARAAQTATELGDKAEAYLNGHRQWTEARAGMRAFLAERPERNGANNARYAKLQAAMQSAQTAIYRSGIK